MNTKSKIKRFNEQRYREWPEEKLALSDKIRIQKIVELVGKRNKVLDVGCFDGGIGEKIMKNGNDVYGLDISEPAVKRAQQKGIKAVCADIEKRWPSDDNSFDVVFAGEIIEHLFDTDRFLKEVKRVLKPSGYLVLTTPNLASLGRRFLLLLGKNPLIETGCCGNDAGHIRYFVKDSLSDLLGRHGFEVVSFSSTVVNLNPSGSLSSRTLAKIFPTWGSSLIVKSRLKK